MTVAHLVFAADSVGGQNLLARSVPASTVARFRNENARAGGPDPLANPSPAPPFSPVTLSGGVVAA